MASGDFDINEKKQANITWAGQSPMRSLGSARTGQTGMPEESADPLIGCILSGKYRILEKVGSGGMSDVYKARDELLDRIVAIKFLATDIDAVSLARFRREGIATGKLENSHIINIHDLYLAPNEQPYLVMDFVDGVPLSDIIEQEGRLSFRRTAHIILQAADALQHAHSRGIIHRDIKPSNIIITATAGDKEFVKLVDFGIAKLKQGEEVGQGLTSTGEVVGSPVYMSPEQCMGLEVDSRSDIYSLGCVFYEMLCGSPPHVGANSLQTMRKHTDEKPVRLIDADTVKDLPPRCDEIVMSCLEKDPKLRYQNLSLFIRDLGQVMEGSTTGVRESRSRRQTVLISLVLALTCALGLLAANRFIHHRKDNVEPVEAAGRLPVSLQEQANPQSKSSQQSTLGADKNSPVLSAVPNQVTLPPGKSPQVTAALATVDTNHATAISGEKARGSQVMPAEKTKVSGGEKIPEVAVTAAKKQPAAASEDMTEEKKFLKKEAELEKKNKQLAAEMAMRDKIDAGLNAVNRELLHGNYVQAKSEMTLLFPSLRKAKAPISENLVATLALLFQGANRNLDYSYGEDLARRVLALGHKREEDPDLKAKVESWLAYFEGQAENSIRSEEKFKKAIANMEKSGERWPWVYFHYGNLLVDERKYSQAEQMYWKALELCDGRLRAKLGDNIMSRLISTYELMGNQEMVAEMKRRQAIYRKRWNLQATRR